MELGKRGGRNDGLTLNSRCSLVSANRTDILLPESFQPRTMRPWSRSIISSAAVRVSSLQIVVESQQYVERNSKSNNGMPKHTTEETYLTNAIILGG